MHFYLLAARKDQIEGSESKANRHAIVVQQPNKWAKFRPFPHTIIN